ncbi:MAG: hypothetical protein QXP81_09665 [Nitrososphaerota archaeon]
MRPRAPRRSRAGLEAPIIALILVIIGVGLALLAGVMVFGRAGVFARAESIKVVEAAAFHQGSCIYVVAKVKNDGAAPITSVQVYASYLSYRESVGSLAETATLQPGGEGSASRCVSFQTTPPKGSSIVVEATGTTPGGVEVRHAIQVPVV